MIAAMLALVAGLTTSEPAVYFRDSTTVAQVTDHPWGGTARIVRRGRAGLPVVMRLDLPPSGMPISSEQFFAGRDLELFVISGSLTVSGRRFVAGDYAFVPAGAPVPARIGSSRGASVLWAEEDVAPASAAIMRQAMAAWRSEGGRNPLNRWTVKRSSLIPWQAGTVAKAAGADVDLKIRHLRNDPKSGARTFLVWTGPGTKVPWERHPSIEEGFLVSGTFTLEECLAEGRKRGVYQPGGYFHRPPGIIHSGPNSGTESPAGAVWLIRTPEKLVADFSASCDAPLMK
jgi:quercetin dioxygenase-like cupin family protein